VAWWITCSGITDGPKPDPGTGPYPTEAKARAAFQAGIRPAGCDGAPAPSPPPAGGNGHGGSHNSALAAAIAQSALDSIGHAYAWGGVPGRDFSNPWDCSSGYNSWSGGMNGASIPGFPDGSYDGTSHGPSTLGWLAWQGQGVGSIDRSEVQPGDILCWRTHMGCAISNTEMVSAQNPENGTQRSGIDGFIQGEQLICLRLAVIGPGGVTLPIPTIGDSAQIEAITRSVARSSQRLVLARMRAASIGKRGWMP
jgi:hypothetical protein